MDNKLLLEIAKCCEVEKAKMDINHSCNKIVCSQKDLGITDFQIPEPWNGHIDTAEILFISSNPSINFNESYPTASWNDEDIISFFENRFEDTPKNQWSRYWKSINKWTGWILGKDSNVNLLKDYVAITEIVHCKSQKEFGVTPHCLKTCFNKWLREILKIFKGKYIIAVGSKAKDYIKEEFTNEKQVIYVPAPNARGITDEKRKQNILNQIR